MEKKKNLDKNLELMKERQQIMPRNGIEYSM